MGGTDANRIERVVEAESPFGDLLRHWRKVRGISQLDLALAVGASQRHLSFLESGRSRPSRMMVLALAEGLDMPLRARNEILAAAGYASYYPERSLAAAALAQTTAILKRMLAHHEPYPAFVLDGGWDMLMVNAAAGHLIAAFGNDANFRSGERRVNFLRLLCDPRGLRPYITSWPHTGPALLTRLRREAAANPGAPVERLLRELLAEGAFPPVAGAEDDVPEATIPVEFRLGDNRLRLVTTTTVFGTPQDVALQELRIEMSFPADDESDRVLRWLSEAKAGELPAL